MEVGIGVTMSVGNVEGWVGASGLDTFPVIAEDTIIFNSAITACEKGRQWQASLCLLERLDRPLSGWFWISVASEWSFGRLLL